MVDANLVRSFLFKLFATILILCFCQLLYEVSQELQENEETRFKRSTGEKEVIYGDIPLQNQDQFIRKKRNNISKKFIPTNEFQEIHDGQIVPSGLHYRINLETGKKEAKLLEKNNKSKELLELKDTVDKTNSLNLDTNQEEQQKAINKLQKEFKKFKFNEKNLELNKDKDLNNWRSMDEIKKEFDNLNIKMTTDSENVNTLLERYRKTNDQEEKIIILKDLSFILHQYDTANDFIKMNGLNVIKDDFLNNQNNQIQSLISTVLGSAASSNPPVKIAILKSGLFDKLIIKLAEENNLKLNLKTVYALSSLLREFPLAQLKFINQNGLKIVKKFFNSTKNDNLNDKLNNDLVKIQTKIISLLTDLNDESKFTLDELNKLRKLNSTKNEQFIKELNNLEEKMKQYNQVNLELNILENNYCPIIAINLNNTNYDIKEKVLKSIFSFRLICKETFKKDYLNDLINIKKELILKVEKDKLNGEIDDEYYQNLIKLTTNLIDYLNL